MSGIVVGVDGSDHAGRALEWAIAEASLRKAPLTVVTVHQLAMDHWGLAELRYPEDEPMREQAGKAAEQAVQKTLATFTGTKPPVRVKAVSGIVPEALIRESQDADLLVVGARGGGFEEVMLGSVSHKVAHHAACPVVIVR